MSEFRDSGSQPGEWGKNEFNPMQQQRKQSAYEKNFSFARQGQHRDEPSYPQPPNQQYQQNHGQNQYQRQHLGFSPSQPQGNNYGGPNNFPGGGYQQPPQHHQQATGFDPRANWTSDKQHELPVDDILKNDTILDTLIAENKSLKKKLQNSSQIGEYAGNQQEVEQLRKQLSELRADNDNLRARANTASIPQQNSNINPRQEDFYKNEIQRHKQKIAALESELSNAQTGQYEKPMPFGAQGGGNQPNSKMQEELDNMKFINQQLQADNQNLNDQLVKLEADKKRIEGELRNANENLKREVANLRANRN